MSVSPLRRGLVLLGLVFGLAATAGAQGYVPSPSHQGYSQPPVAYNQGYQQGIPSQPIYNQPYDQGCGQQGFGGSGFFFSMSFGGGCGGGFSGQFCSSCGGGYAPRPLVPIQQNCGYSGCGYSRVKVKIRVRGCTSDGCGGFTRYSYRAKYKYVTAY